MKREQKIWYLKISSFKNAPKQGGVLFAHTHRNAATFNKVEL